jgi:hypothetical protein
MFFSLENGRSLFLLCMAAIPFEMIISVARHQLALHIGPFGYLLHPATGIAIGCLMLRPRLRIKEEKWILWCLAIYAVGLAVSGAVIGSSPFYVISTLALGPLFMALVIVVLTDDDLATDAIKAFLIGVSVWSAAFFIFYLWNAHAIIDRFPFYTTLPFGQFMMALRSPGEDLWRDLYYFKLLGNFNKQANILTLSLILASYLYVRGAVSLKSWLIFTIPISVMLFLMFSRGAFVALGLFAVGLALTSLISSHSERRLVSSAAALLVVLFSFSTAEWRDYWHDKGSIVQRDAMAASVFSGSERFLKSGELAAVRNGSGGPKTDEFCEAQEPERSSKMELFGYGLGNYGPTICRGPGAESHNAFIDAWIQGGVLGFVGYVGLFITALVLGIARLFRSRFEDQAALFGLAVVSAVAVLAMREYAFVYLWVQSAGGFLLALGIAMITSKKAA